MLKHGGDILSYKKLFNKDPIDFSANISPLGMPKSVLAAATNALSTANLYPDPLCRSLTEAISIEEKISTEFILTGNGAADLIFRVVYALKPLLSVVISPSFSEYADAVNGFGGEIIYHNTKEENDFILDESIIDLIKNKKPQLLFLCNPSNPTGQVIKKELLLKILEVSKETNTKVLLDECFIDFLNDVMYFSAKGELSHFNNLIILKAFTKTYAMAGLRLGYVLCCDKSFIQKLREVAQPWAVSNIAQEAGKVALNEKEYLKTLKELINSQRDFLKAEFLSLGITVIGSHANFLFFKSPNDSLFDELLERGILVRNCDNFKNLPKNFLRCAIKTQDENEILVKTIKAIL